MSAPDIQSETLNLLEWSRLCDHLSTFASTKLGARVARQLSIPTRITESQQLLQQTQEVYQLEAKLPAGLKFSGIQDIGDDLERAERQGMLTAESLLGIATTLSSARQLRRVIDAQEAEDVPVLTELVEELRTYPELEQEIHRCIDDRGEVADRASPKLGDIRAKQKQVRDQIYQTLQRLMQRNGNAVQEQLITQRGDRFVIPVKAPQKDVIPGIVHDASASGATLYIEPHRIVESGNRLRQLNRQEQTEVEAILRRLTEQVAEVKPDLEQLLAIVTTLDLATARARYSLWLKGNPPRFIEQVDQETITLRQLRHPLLIWQEQHEQGHPVVPIDLLIKPQIRVVAITGPNTGGKTVTLKTLGLAVLMAKVGLFIPAREPVELPWFERVLADIGDEQSLEQSLSTFSGHIRRISRILGAIPDAEGSANALVLLDEVGAGTDPSEGSALAIALLRHLAAKAHLTIATTHFGELKALKYEDERFENASVEFNDQTLSPTYRLLWGIPGRSNALTIAQRLGLETEVVEQAQALIGATNHEDVNQVIAGLEEQRRRQESSAEETSKILQQAEQLYKEVSRKSALLKEREQELKQQQEQAIQQAIAQAKGEIAAVIRRLQRGNATAQDAQAATEQIDKLAEKKLPSRQQPAKPQPGYRPSVGERVRIPRIGQTAEVLTEPDADGELNVRFGLMKMTVSLADVESLQGEKAEMPPKPEPKAVPQVSVPAAATPSAPAVRTQRNTVDLRGQRVSEAEPVLETAIASAQGPLWVIHGYGTGKLRRGVHEFLKRHPQVARFEDADQSDGGKGVTVVYVTLPSY